MQEPQLLVALKARINIYMYTYNTSSMMIILNLLHFVLSLFTRHIQSRPNLNYSHTGVLQVAKTFILQSFLS